MKKKIGKKLGVDWDLFTNLHLTKQTIWKDIGWLCYLAGRLQNLNILIFLGQKNLLELQNVEIHGCTFIFQAKYFVYSWCDIENTVYCYTFEDIKTGCIMLDEFYSILKFVYSEKATKFCEIFTLLLSYVVPVKSKVEISQTWPSQNV